jgi:raffinose/stachyose/melibiose transport system substrate-binding protein
MSIIRQREPSWEGTPSGTEPARRPGRSKATKLGAAMLCAALSVPLVGAGVSSASSPSSASVTITISMQNANEKAQDPATYDIVQAFMQKYPNIKVVLGGQPVAQHETDMEIAAQSGTLPTIFWVYNALALPMEKDGDLLNLTPIMNSLGLTAKLKSNLLSGFRNGSVQYGFPYQTLVTGLYYNKAILAKYGLSLPTTFDQLVSVAKVLHSHGVVTIAQGADNSSYSVWVFLKMLDQFGYQNMYQSILAGKASYNNPQFLNLYNDILTLQQAGAFPSDASTQSYFQAVQSFLAGKAAMLDSGVWQAFQIDTSPIAHQVGWWWGPTFSNGVGNQHVLMDAAEAPLVVSGKVKSDPALYNAVKEFFAFYYSNEGQQLMVNNAIVPDTNYLPPINAAKQPVFADILTALHDPGWVSPEAQPDLIVSAATANAMYDSMYGLIEGVYTPTQALEVVQKSF